LDGAQEEFSASEECCREVLRIVAKRWLGLIDDSAMNEASEVLCAIATKDVEMDVRLKALCAMPYILTATRNAGALAQFGRALTEIPFDSLDAYQRIQLLLPKAWREDQIRNDSLARSLIDEAVRLVDSTETASSVAVRVLVGAGMLRVEHGEYKDALPLLARAAGMARQIDNNVHLSAAAAGLAIAHGRLGDTASQLTWASTALACIRGDDWGIIAISATYEKALALTFEERFSEASNTVRDLDRRFARRRPAWATQAWHLVKADILALCGNTRGAFSAATNGTSGRHATLLLNDFAGLHARWSSLMAVRTGTESSALRELRTRAEILDGYHAKDRAEILAAIALLEARVGESADTTWAAVATQLEKLPESVSTVMRRLGTLPPRATR
jgi:tetratricopeptide (TPR) repeat protein